MKNNKADLMFKEGFSVSDGVLYSDLRMNQSALSDLGTDRERYGQSLRGRKNLASMASERMSVWWEHE